MKVTQVRLNAAAKLNLTLDITGLREDGYHLLDSIMCTVSLYDTVHICATQTGTIELSSSDRFLPVDGKNTCFKAAKLYFDACEKEIPGVKIYVEKCIPSCAGMGGGSADAAAVLRGMEYIFGKCPVELASLAVKIGADVPFCLAGGIMRCQGIGEIMSPVPVKVSKLQNLHLVVAKNARGLSTPYMFSQYDAFDQSLIARPNPEGLIKALREKSLPDIARCCANVLQPVAISERPEIAELIDMIKRQGALNAVMTGSGAAVFGIFDSFSRAQSCAEALNQAGIFARYAKIVAGRRG